MYERILVSTDGSTPSHRALDEAAKLLKLTHGTARVVSVAPSAATLYASGAYAGFTPVVTQDEIEKETREILDTALQHLQQQGVKADTQLLECTDTEEIADAILKEAQAWKADVIVLGTHGRRGVRRLLLGSVAETLLRISTVPLLLVRAPDATE